MDDEKETPEETTETPEQKAMKVAQEVEGKFGQVMRILQEIQDLQPTTPIIFYGLGESKYFSRCGLDYVQLGMLSEMQSIIAFASAQAFHVMQAQQNKPRIVKPGQLVPVSNR